MKNSLSILVLVLLPSLIAGQTLTIVASGGDAGPTSGTNWSIDGTVLTVSGTANINASVISSQLQSGSFNIKGNTTSFAVTISGSILNNTHNGSVLTIGESGNSGNISITSTGSISNAGAITIYGGVIDINGNITSSADGDIFIKSISTSNDDIWLHGTRSITKSGGSGTLTMQAHRRILCDLNSNITTSGGGRLNVVLWSDYDNNNDGGSSAKGSISTNGGHVWIGGSSTNGGSYTWNGLTVGNGPSVGAAGSNLIDVDLFGNVTTSGGDFLAWAGNGGTTISGIGTNGSNNLVNTGSGNISLITDRVKGNAGTSPIRFQTTGTFTLAPYDGSFPGTPSTFIWNPSVVNGTDLLFPTGDFERLEIVNYTSLGGLKIGRYNGMISGSPGSPVVLTNSSKIQVSTSTTIGAPIEFHCGDFTADATVTATSNTLTVDATGAVTLNAALMGGTTTVNVQGNLKTTGSLTNVNFTSTNAQTITGTGTVQYVTVNKSSNGVTIAPGANKLYVTGVFTPTSGVTTTNGNLVFRSSSSEDGVVGVTGTCPSEPLSGPVTVEKYIPAKRAYRFLTPGVTTSTPINANWQEGGIVSSTAAYPYTAQGTENPNPGYGTHITGGSSNGLDPTLTGNPSLFTYNVNINAWVALTNTSTATMRSGEGYRILVRGSRAMNLNENAPTPDATVLRTTGTLNVCGSVTFNDLSTVPLNAGSSGYSLVGNPYWSVVDWSLVDKSNIENNLYYWDPTVNGTNGRGAYVSVNTAGLNNLEGSSLNQYIQPGQAFFVKNTGTSPQMTFDRTDVVPGNRRPIFGRAGSLNGLVVGQDASDAGSVQLSGEIEQIQLSLFLKDRMPQSGPTDGALVCFQNDFTEGYGREDAGKLSNLDENLSVEYGGRSHSILGLPSSGSDMRTDTIPLKMWNLYPSEYILRVGLQSLDPTREVWLFDKSNGRSVQVTNDRLDHSFLQAAGVVKKDDLLLVVHNRVPFAKEDGSEAMLLFPNPTMTDKVRFAVPMQGLTPEGGRLSSTAEILDISGTLKLSRKVELDGHGRGVLEVSALNRGAYVLRVQVGGKVFISKLIRQ
jgi:hypothetical protein